MTKQTEEALKMAIEAMECAEKVDWELNSLHVLNILQAIQACKEALEQPAQEPVAWINVKDKLPPQEINFLSFSETFGYQVSMYSSNPFNSTLLPTLERLKITKWMPIPYITHPALSWQGLSDDEILEIDKSIDPKISIGKGKTLFARAIEQELKTKNGFSGLKEKNT